MSRFFLNPALVTKPATGWCKDLGPLCYTRAFSRHSESCPQTEKKKEKSCRAVVTQGTGHLNFTFFPGPRVQLLSDVIEYINGSFDGSPGKSSLHNTIHYLFSLSTFSKTCIQHVFLIIDYDLCLFIVLKTLTTARHY